MLSSKEDSVCFCQILEGVNDLGPLKCFSLWFIDQRTSKNSTTDPRESRSHMETNIFFN